MMVGRFIGRAATPIAVRAAPTSEPYSATISSEHGLITAVVCA
jgi:hypothetical protein